MPSRRTLRSIVQLGLTALLLTIYGSTGVFRYSLHTVFDCEHCVISQQKECSTDEECDQPHSHCCACSHSHEHEKVTLPKSGAQLAAQEAACPICAFLAQAQSPIYQSSGLQLVAYLPGERPLDERAAPNLLAFTAIARGPPTT